MTKKDYVALASIIRNNLAIFSSSEGGYEGERHAIKEVAGDLSAVLEKDTPRFDRSRFLKACGIEE